VALHRMREGSRVDMLEFHLDKMGREDNEADLSVAQVDGNALDRLANTATPTASYGSTSFVSLGNRRLRL
jgi:hypothetical protein